MGLLIAQGPGYYGVNIRLIDEATYERLLAKDEYRWTSDDPNSGDFDCVMGSTGDDRDKTILIMTRSFEAIERYGAITSESAGFDTGWWEQGEAAIEEVLK